MLLLLSAAAAGKTVTLVTFWLFSPNSFSVVEEDKFSERTFLLDVELLFDACVVIYEDVSGILCVVVDGTGVLEEGFVAKEVVVCGASEDNSIGFAVVVL